MAHLSLRHTAWEAREQVKRFKPDLMRMDIRRPDVDGVAAAKQLKTNPATHDVRVVAFTACAMKGDEQRLLAAGFRLWQAYLLKYCSSPQTQPRYRSTPFLLPADATLFRRAPAPINFANALKSLNHSCVGLNEW